MSIYAQLGVEGSIFSLAAVRVLIVPIGHVPQDVFGRYVNALKRSANAVHSNELTLPSSLFLSCNECT